MSRIDAAHRRDIHRRDIHRRPAVFVDLRLVTTSRPVISFRVNWRLQANALIHLGEAAIGGVGNCVIVCINHLETFGTLLSTST